MKSVIKVVKAVREAKKRIPARFSHLTFFSHEDWWIYHAVLDDRTCPICRDYASGDMLNGSFVRAAFPYLQIVDENTIRVNLHPNCRCWLERVKVVPVFK